MTVSTRWAPVAIALAIVVVYLFEPLAQAQESGQSSMAGHNGGWFGTDGEGPGMGLGSGLGAAGKRFGGGPKNAAFLKQKGRGERWSGQSKPQLVELVVAGTKRRYYLYRPASAKLHSPLVLAFHGSGGTAEGTDKCAGGLARLADEKGFIVVYPDAMDKHWNDGRAGLAKRSYDDVGFISTVIDDLAGQNLIDPKRVYATGISNGGFFSQYLAIQLPDKIAAVATVAASVLKTFLDLKVQPVPIMMLLGTKDTLVPWSGGRIGGGILLGNRGEVISGRDALQFWIGVNGSTAKPICAELPDNDPGDGSRVFVEQYGAPGSANEVVFYEIRGGGHTWPTGQQYLPKFVIGPVCRDFDGNEAIWKFFENHTHR